MSSDVFWKSPPWCHLNAVPQVNCSTRLVHWQQNFCHSRLSVCAEQTAYTHWLIEDVNGRSSSCSTQTNILQPVHGGTLRPERTGSQWSSRITGVMRSNFLALMTRQAAAFWSDCSLSSSRPLSYYSRPLCILLKMWGIATTDCLQMTQNASYSQQLPTDQALAG